MHSEMQAAETAPMSEAGRHWRWGITRSIALLREEPEDLEKLGVHFEEESDDLDRLRHARLATPAGRVFALVRYRDSPQRGTEVVTREDSTDFEGDLNQVLLLLKLNRDDVLWEHPLIAAARATENVASRLQPRLRITAVLLVALQVAAIGLVIGGRVRGEGWTFAATLVAQVIAVFATLIGILSLARVARSRPQTPRGS